MSIRLTAAFIFSAASVVAGTFTGPVSDYYISDRTTMWDVRGTSIVNSWAVTGLPAAIDTTIRTTGNFSGQSGAQYTLSGVATGTTYTNPIGSGQSYDIWDGTTDGRHNYTVTTVCSGCPGNAVVLQTDLDWSNPVVLFTLAISGYDSLGITYDASNNSLWVSKWDAGTAITNYSMTGAVLGSFSTGFGEIGALALDPADGTLWATTFGSSTLYQFDKSGNLLQSGTIAGLGTALWSGEFGQQAIELAATPEPGTVVMFSAGLGIVAMRRRRTQG
jgi:hypothetical protein